MRRVRGRWAAAAGVMALIVVAALLVVGRGWRGEAFEGRGPITYAAGEDLTGVVRGQLDRWNEERPDERVTFVELSADPDEQRRELVRVAEAGSDEFAVLSLDVVWTAEFAANGWIAQLPEKRFPLDAMLPPVVETARYGDELYAVPMNADGGLLYYRTDLLERAGIAQPPMTWAALRDACAAVLALPEAGEMSCYAGQFERYEGLTVNFAEALHSARAEIVDRDGRPRVDTLQARAGLDFLVDAFRDGLVPEGAIAFTEEEGREAFRDGELVFMRQWPYAYTSLAADDGSSAVAGDFDVALLPGLLGLGSSSLGGHNLAVSSFAEHGATAIDFIRFMTNEENAHANLAVGSNAPAYGDLYDDPESVRRYPYLPVLKQSIIGALPRPQTVNYSQVSAAVQEAAQAAMTGEKPSDLALSELQETLLGLVGE
ncbi:ABC transporter substrate-binding protein [Streptomyces sp. NBRC 109706]|uniref:ABC transporter substrate-binding protein n=1 Tax=Streptomyces sp. NBRC 109706 TaxID=1550035 RepID=UPI000AF77DB2|nr:ABC transporter substrate-binding protein [Streptomyces sp. NBRC 109706]